MATTALLLSACSGGEPGQLPADSDIARLEAKLTAHPCVGSLDQWERNYRFAVGKGVFVQERLKPDFQAIQFHFREAGEVRIAPARNVVAVGETGSWPESRLIRTVDGLYQLKSGKLTVARCRPVSR